MKFVVTVTQPDIDESKRRKTVQYDCLRDCPVAIAFKRGHGHLFPERGVRVGYTHISVEGESYDEDLLLRLPRDAVSQIKDFDMTNVMQPFAFEVDENESR